MKRAPQILIYCTACLFLWTCSGDRDEVVITVNGPIPASEMGRTLTHEHVLVDFIGADSTGYHRWERNEVVERVLPYIRGIQEYGVETFFECTPAFIGRDPRVLKSLARESGVHMVTNTGYYGAQHNKFLPEDMAGMTPEVLAARWVHEFRHGIDNSGIRPGFIKIAVGDNEQLSATHRKIVAAAARTHFQTGMAIASHTGPDRPAFQQIGLLDSMGVDLSAFIWVHAQGGTLGGNIDAAEKGVWISLDNVNERREGGPDEDGSPAWYAERISDLKEAGYLDRVLISHDAGWYSPGEENGGDFRGYTAIFEELVPLLRERNFSGTDIDQLLVTNPARAFAIRKVR